MNQKEKKRKRTKNECSKNFDEKQHLRNFSKGKFTSAQQLLIWATVWPQETWVETGGVVPLMGGGSWIPM